MFVKLRCHFFIDIDECNEAIHTCEQICTNDDGVFNCSCYSGYTMDTNTSKCVEDEGLYPYEYDFLLTQGV